MRSNSNCDKILVVYPATVPLFLSEASITPESYPKDQHRSMRASEVLPTLFIRNRNDLNCLSSLRQDCSCWYRMGFMPSVFSVPSFYAMKVTNEEVDKAQTRRSLPLSAACTSKVSFVSHSQG